jgi:hypothetical protein
MMQNPKPESRNPKEARNPESELGSAPLIGAARCYPSFRISAFGFPSAFGLRLSAFTSLSS